VAISDSDIKLIENHLQGLLTPAEKIAFEKRKSDVVFLAELDLYLKIKKSSKAIGRSQIRQVFTSWDKEASITKIGSWSQMGWKIAAGLLIAIGLIGILKIFSPSKDSAELFAEYYQPYPNLIDPIQKGDASSTQSITQLYELGKYENVLAQSLTNSVDSFYVALTFLQLDQSKETITILEKFAHLDGFRFRDAAQWYLALSLIRNEQIESSLEVLTEISKNPNHDHLERARKLLDQLME